MLPMDTKSKNRVSQDQAAGYFWKLLELNVLPVIMWDATGTIFKANDAFLKMIGYTLKELEEGKINWRALTPKESLPADENCEQQLKTKTIADPYEKKYIRRDGSEVKIKMFTAVLKPGDDHGITVIIPVK
jgi:PAS domain S-box-containing protein